VRASRRGGRLLLRNSLALAVSAVLLVSCASSYSFVSQPPGAATYLKQGSEKKYLGETPLEFSKANLPNTDPFVISIEKDGYMPREVSILPTNQSQTNVRVSLAPSVAGTGDAALARVRVVVTQILDAQEKAARRNFVGALATLSELEKSEPRLPEIFVIRGSIYVLLKQPNDARAQWTKALELDPRLENIKVRLSQLQTGSQPPAK
jgi:tetratricopeptide (TPR) repeat protein